MLMPSDVRNYSDFMASFHHVTNVGRAFNRPEPQVRSNWYSLPVAYHSRASSVVVSGTPIHRPSGQILPGGKEPAIFAPSRKLDYELEMGIFVGPGNALGRPIRMSEVEGHIFGLVLMNDWSARDIQSWESNPLGPFLGKSAGTPISPWVVTLEALAPFRAENDTLPEGERPPLDYLAAPKGAAPQGFDITLEAHVLSNAARKRRLAATLFTHTNLRRMYWSIFQMVVHHTCNGCNLLPGDLLGTGTVSGPTRTETACLIERTLDGREPMTLATGEKRGFIEDGDDVIFSGMCSGHGARPIGFGECHCPVLPPVAAGKKARAA
jgi:fumarylacetoacetase